MEAAVWVRRAGIAVLVIGVAYLVFSIWDHDAFMRWIQDASPVPFFLAMAVLPAIGVPLTPFMVVAGATFGFWGGLIGTAVAVSINLFIAYAIAHSALRPRLDALLRRFDYKVPDFTGGGRAAWRFSAAIKLTPALPTSAKHYMLAVTSVPFAIAFLVSVGITIVFAVAWVLLGESLLSHDVSNTTLAAAAICVLALVAVMWWKKRRGVTGDDALPAV
jgi:uncharacterized membrane protein YdjX (TVP38/TMEM64 family)